MSRTIDERIVEMRFDNEQFQQNIQDSIDSLERLKSELDLKESAKGLNQLGKAGKSFSLASVSESVEGIASKFSTMGIIGVTALQNITNSAIAAGKRIVSALTIQPVTTGFNEYELKMDSIKTIMAGSKEDLETVKKYLEELNKYSDETIYSFSDMTQNIGKFTNAGVKLEDAVAAIKGISNEAALAGANANEASRAMYNFAQAMSSGYVKLIDWKSIELANMATVEFKEELIKTALELKTIKKLENGMFQSITTDMNGSTSDAFNATQGFNDSLAHTWMTNDVLVKTLSRYADATTDIGRRANEAASEVRTFSKMMDTLKESAQSGWSTTWELLVGDMEEATELFTTLNNIIGGLLDTMAKNRNNKLSEWLDLGGKQTVYDAFGYLHNTLIQIGTILKDSFRKFFPASTGKTLLTFTEKFRDAMMKLFMFVDNNKNVIRSVFDGLFSILKAGTTIIKNVRKAIWNLVKVLLPAGDGLMGLVERLSDYLVDVSTAIRDSELFETAINGVATALDWAITSIGKFVDFIHELRTSADLSGVADTLKRIKEDFHPFKSLAENLTKIMDKLRKAFNWVKEALSGLGEKFKPVFDKIGTAIKDADLGTLIDILISLATGGLILSLASFITTLKKTFKDFRDILDIFDNLGGLISSFSFKNLASGILMLAGAFFIIGMIPADKMASTLGIFTGVVAEFITAMYALNKLFSADDALFGTIKDKASALQKVSVTMALLGLSLLMCASAVKKLGSMEWQEAMSGAVWLAGIMVSLVFTMKHMDMIDIPLQTAASMLVMAWALSSFVRVLKKLGSFFIESPDKAFAGYFALSGMFLAIGAFVRAVPEADLLKTAAGILIIGIAINKLYSTMELLSGMSFDQAVQAVGGIVGLLFGLSLAISKMPDSKKALAGSAGIRIMASALKVVSDSIVTLSSIGLPEMLSSAIILMTVMGMLVLAIQSLDALNMGVDGLLSIGAFLALAVALRILTPALVQLNDVKWDSLLKLGAVLVVLFALGAAAGNVVAIGIGMLMVAGSVTLLGLGCKMAGEGALDFAVAMEKLAVSGRKGGKALADIFMSIIEIMPEFAESAGEAIVEFATAISNGSDAIREALIKVGTSAAAASVSIGFEMVASFLKGIKDGAKDLGKDMKDALIAVLESLSENLPPLIDKSLKLVIDIMNGMADALEENNDELRAASIRIGQQVGEGMVIGIESALAAVFSAGETLGDVFFIGLQKSTDVHSPSRRAKKIARFIGDGLVDGTKDASGDVYNAGFGLGRSAMEGLRDGTGVHSETKEGQEVGYFIAKSVGTGAENGSTTLYDTLNKLGYKSVDELSGFDDSFFNIGTAMAESYNNGLTSGMYAYADPLAGMREMIEKDIEDNKRQDLLDPSLWRMRKELTSGIQNDVTSMLDNIEVKTEKTRKEMTTGIGYGINHRLSMGLKLYSEQAMKAAEEAKERTLRPITDMSKNFNFDTTKIENTFARLTDNTSRLNAELELEDNVTVNHTFDKLVVEGVNNKGEFVAAADYSVEKVIASLMRRQGRV